MSQAKLDPRLSLFVMSSAPAKKSAGMPDVRPKIHRPIHDKSHKISTQIRARKRSSHVCALELATVNRVGALNGMQYSTIDSRILFLRESSMTEQVITRTDFRTGINE